jgi:hypothetical protein
MMSLLSAGTNATIGTLARLLKQLKPAGKQGRASSALNCSAAGLAPLVAAGYVSNTRSDGLDLVLYRITDAGKKELANVCISVTH